MGRPLAYPLCSNKVTKPVPVKRFTLVIIIAALFALPATHLIIKQSLIDAFYQVAVFVAATLYLFHHIGSFVPSKIKQHYVEHKYLSIPFAALMGALPGCGGAIIIVTQYTQQKTSFAALVTVLIATMGDAAFLLIATEPSTAFVVLSVSTLTAIVFGLIIRLIHPDDFLLPQTALVASLTNRITEGMGNQFEHTAWQWAIIPSFMIGLLMAFQVDLSAYSPIAALITQWFAIVACFFILISWSLKGASQPQFNSTPLEKIDSTWQRVVSDTHFVTTWVIVAFMSYELVVNFIGLDLKTMLQQAAILTPLIAAAIGLLPGCGPQILVTSLYLQGVMPISGLIANAISNDGDALFPAIALAPKAACIATLYSTIPALIVGYGFYFYY